MAENESEKTGSARIPQLVVDKIKRAAQEKISQAEQKADAVRRMDLKRLLPDAYEEVLLWMAADLREQHDPSMPGQSISIPIPLPCDRDCKMQVHIGQGADIKRPKILIEFGTNL